MSDFDILKNAETLLDKRRKCTGADEGEFAQLSLSLANHTPVLLDRIKQLEDHLQASNSTVNAAELVINKLETELAAEREKAIKVLDETNVKIKKAYLEYLSNNPNSMLAPAAVFDKVINQLKEQYK